MKFAVLASSSKGNCTYLQAGATKLLVDAGTSWLNIRRLLSGIGADANALDGIVVTHDHVDHVSALCSAQKRRAVPVYATAGTVEAVCETNPGAEDWPWVVIGAGEPFQVGETEISPFSVPHDAGDPVGYVVRHGDAKLGFATDLGEATLPVRLALADCDALALEFNHEKRMLMDSARPWSLKQRICGRSGHLSNEQAADLLSLVATPRLKHLVPMHLSAECNTPEAAMAAARAVLLDRGLPLSVLVAPVCPTAVLEIP